MAYEAASAALEGAPAPGAVIAVTQSAPFGLRKLSATLARTLGLDEALPLDVGGNAASLLDAFEIAAALAGDGAAPALVVATDHLVSYEDRVCDLLSAGAATAFLIGGSGGIARLGASARASREVYDVWRLGTEPEARFRLEVLFDAYGQTTREALGRLASATERATSDYAAVAASQPHPQTLRGLGKAGVAPGQLEHTSFVGEIGNLGAASVGVALALGLDARRRGRSPARARLRRRRGDRPGHRGALGAGIDRHGRADPGRGDRPVHVLPLDPWPPGRTPLREA